VVMSLWDERVVPRMVDAALKGREVGELRGRVCGDLHGRVLEVGFGSGLNVRWYPPSVTSVSAVEPSDLGWEMSRRRRALADLPIVRSGLDGQRLTEDDASHDCVLVTFTLCSIPDASAALDEVARVLRPGGTLHVLEHGLAPEPSVRRWQRRLDPVQRRVAGGCHLTRDVPAMLAAAGFEKVWAEQRYLPGPTLGRPWTYGHLGVHRRP
jgi:SAM-dependent methyltransferase